MPVHVSFRSIVPDHPMPKANQQKFLFGDSPSGEQEASKAASGEASGAPFIETDSSGGESVSMNGAPEASPDAAFELSLIHI